MFHVIIEGGPEDRKCGNKNEEASPAAEARKHSSGQCFVIRHMLEHVQGIDVIDRFRLVFFHCCRDGESKPPKNSLIFGVRFDAIGLEATGTKHFWECAPPGSEIGNLSGIPRHGRDDLVGQPTIIISRFLQ